MMTRARKGRLISLRCLLGAGGILGQDGHDGIGEVARLGLPPRHSVCEEAEGHGVFGLAEHVARECNDVSQRAGLRANHTRAREMLEPRLERAIGPADRQLGNVLGLNRRVAIGRNQSLRQVVRRDAVAFEQTRAVHHRESGDVDAVRAQLLEHDGHPEGRGAGRFGLGTHDLEQHLCSEVVAPLAHGIEERAQLARRHVGQEGESLDDGRIPDRESAAHSDLAEGAYPEARRMRPRVGYASPVVEGTRRHRHLATHGHQERRFVGRSMVDSKLRWAARLGLGPVVDLDVAVFEDPYATFRSSRRSGADVHDVAVAVDRERRDRRSKRSGFIRLLVECRGQQAIVEIPIVDDDLVDEVYTSKPESLRQREERPIPEARVASWTQDEQIDLAITEQALDARRRSEGGAELPRRRRRQELLVGCRIERCFSALLVEYLTIVNPDDLDAYLISEPRLADEPRDRSRGRPRSNGGHRERSGPTQGEDDRGTERSSRHRAQTSSVLAWVLAIVAGCTARHPSTNDVLTVVIPREAEQLDPRFVGDPYGLRVSRLLFASLVTIDPRTLEVIPDLAESVVPVSPTVYEVTLRPGLRFNDGSPLRADDVAETFRGVVDPELGSRYARTYRRIRSIEVKDGRTLRFVLHEPHATFLTDLELPIVRRVDAHRRMTFEPGSSPVGAGPYRLVEQRQGLLELHANPYWHRGMPRVPRLRLVVIRDDNTRALRMLAGQGDLAIGSVPPLLLPMFEEHPDFKTKTAPGVSTMYLGFNTRSPKLEDVRVRRAIAAAVDRKLLVEAKYRGLGRVTETWIPSGHWAEAPSLPRHEFDPKQARALLDEAGYRRPTASTQRMRLVLRTTSDRFRQSVARAIAGMLHEVGIDVDVRPSEAASLISDLNKGRFELTLLQVPEVLEPHVLSWFFDSSRIPGPRGHGANRWRYENPELDALFEEGRTHVALEERRDAYARAQQILARDLPVLSLWQPHTVAVIRRGVDFDVPRDGRFGTLAF